MLTLAQKVAKKGHVFFGFLVPWAWGRISHHTTTGHRARCCACGACVSRRRKQAEIRIYSARERARETSQRATVGREKAVRSCFFFTFFFTLSICAFCDEGIFFFKKEELFARAASPSPSPSPSPSRGACFGGRWDIAGRG